MSWTSLREKVLSLTDQPVGGWTKRKQIKALTPDVFSVTAFLAPDVPLLGRLQVIISNEVPQHPVCPQCKVSLLKWIPSQNAWQEFCSKECASLARWGTRSPNQSPVVQAKKEATCLARYGVKNPNQSPVVQAKKEATCLARYGAKNVLQVAAVQAKAQDTCRERYGCTCPIQSPIVQEKVRATNKQRYAVEHPIQTPALQAKARETMQARYGVDYAQQSLTIRQKTEITCQARYGASTALTAPSLQEAKQKTIHEKYGTDVNHPSQAPSVQAKRAATNLQRYGTVCSLQNPKVQEKVRASLQRKYGVQNSAQIPSARAKASQTNIALYGTPCSLSSPLIRRKIARTKQIKAYGPDLYAKIHTKAFWMHEVLELRQSLLEVSVKYQLNHTRCSEWFAKYTGLTVREAYFGLENYAKLKDPAYWAEEYEKKQRTLEQIAKDFGISDGTAGQFFHEFSGLELRETLYHAADELSLLNWIKTVYPYPEEVTSTTYAQIARDKGLNPPQRRFTLDIFLPRENLGIEFNGLYWHSNEFHPEPTYHLEKTLELNKLGCRLIHIWSDDWELKQDLIKSKLLSILNLSQVPRIHARECTIRIPTKEEKRTFYEQNHIKGDGQGQVSYALEHPHCGTVAMITLKTTSTPGTYDLNRFATNINFRVPGAFSKLFTHFQRNNQFTQIYTYADRAWSDGNVYKQSGFTLTSTTPPAFHGIEYNKRISRRAYTHERLRTRFPEFYTMNLSPTQLQVLQAVGINLIYDCGNLRFDFLCNGLP
jgi:hypothetical protein